VSIKVLKLTPEQAEELSGQEYASSSVFAPVQDAEGSWFIGKEEAAQCSIDWVKELPEIDYKPKKPNIRG
jgi:hypothetical protein